MINQVIRIELLHEAFEGMLRLGVGFLSLKLGILSLQTDVLKLRINRF